MIVSLSWLKDYVATELDIASLADALTMVGLEVEAVWDRYSYLNSIVVGKITHVSPHPNAEKLTVCTVDIGDLSQDVVCGAPNAAKDLMVPLALPGAVFPNGTTIEKCLIRGVESSGMLCSEHELALGAGKDTLMELSQTLKPGISLAEALALCDYVMEIGLTPNRSDCLSILGIAREIAAIEKIELKYPPFLLNDSSGDISRLTSVTIETPEHCPRYCARLVENVTIGSSPFWLQDRLTSVGLRPLNAIVDITNFVMMETGQPLHAFNFDHLSQNRIVVRTATAGEVFTTLDGKNRILSSEMLMICDGEKPVAIGGVMGGENSEIQDDTTRVLIESAYFDPVSIRKTSKSLGLNTDASHRFERGVDPDGTIKALNRAASLMADISGGRIVPGLIDENPIEYQKKSIELKTSEANKVLGISLETHQIRKLLESIGFGIESMNSQKLQTVVPSFRVDVERPQDLMEEVARLYGYDRIPTTFPLIPAQRREPSVGWLFRGRVKDLMRGLGFNEVVNYSFVDDKSCDLLRLDEQDERRKLLKIINPLSEDMAVMRTSLVPGLLRTMHLNLAQQAKNLRIFEIGNIFISRGQDELPDEKEFLAALWTGSRHDHCVHIKDAECDFYDVKGAVEALLRSLEIQGAVFTEMPPSECPYTQKGQSAKIIIQGKNVGLVGQLHPQVLAAFDLKQKAFIFELNQSILSYLTPQTKKFQPIPKFPPTSRDITIIVEKQIESRQVVEMAGEIDNALVESVFLYDVYEGAPIPKGHKSITLRIVYRSAEKTLEDADVTPVTEKIAKYLLDKLHATLPG
ncbi:MAG: phenylalanine--tRNA ligase subunit beta [Desulfobacterales bacterium]